MKTLTQIITLASKIQSSTEMVEKINNTIFGEDLWEILNNLRIDEYLKSNDDGSKGWLCTNMDSNEFVFVEWDNNTFSLYSEENTLIDSYTI